MYKKFVPYLKKGIIDNRGNQNKLTNILWYKSSSTEILNSYVPLSQYG